MNRSRAEAYSPSRGPAPAYWPGGEPPATSAEGPGPCANQMLAPSCLAYGDEVSARHGSPNPRRSTDNSSNNAAHLKAGVRQVSKIKSVPGQSTHPSRRTWTFACWPDELPS